MFTYNLECLNHEKFVKTPDEIPRTQCQGHSLEENKVTRIQDDASIAEEHFPGLAQTLTGTSAAQFNSTTLKSLSGGSEPTPENCFTLCKKKERKLALFLQGKLHLPRVISFTTVCCHGQNHSFSQFCLSLSF